MRFPTAQDIGFASEMDAFGLNFCHGLGLGLHERPLISRLNSFEEPIELKAGMVFAVETYCPASDGVSAARIEEEVILTPDGREGHLAVPGAGAADRQPVLIPDHGKHYFTQARLDRHRPHGLRDGRAARRGRRRHHRLEPHPRQGRAARRAPARRSPERSPISPAATSSSSWCRPRTTSSDVVDGPGGLLQPTREAPRHGRSNARRFRSRARRSCARCWPRAARRCSRRRSSATQGDQGRAALASSCSGPRAAFDAALPSLR